MTVSVDMSLREKSSQLSFKDFVAHSEGIFDLDVCRGLKGSSVTLGLCAEMILQYGMIDLGPLLHFQHLSAGMATHFGPVARYRGGHSGGP